MNIKVNGVSVYITTKNRPDLLKRAIASVIRQDIDNIEVLIMNDGSNLDYEKDYNEIVNEYSHYIPIKYFINEVSKGACYSRNYLIHRSKYDYVTGLDDDDYFLEGRLKLFIDVVNNSLVDYSLICANVITYDHGFSIDKENKSEGKVISFENMKYMNVVGNQAFLKKENIISVGGFDEGMPAWQDYDLWFRIIKEKGSAYKLNSSTLYLDTNNDRVRISTSSNAHMGYLKFIEKHNHYLNKENLTSLNYMDKINRKESFSLASKDLIGSWRLQLRLLKYRSTYYYPKAYEIYQKIMKTTK